MQIVSLGKLSPKETIGMKWRSLFWGKIKKNIITFVVQKW